MKRPGTRCNPLLWYMRHGFEALDNLASHEPIEADLVKLRYFIGLTVEEAAKLLEISPRTARNYWAHARAWLYHEIAVRGH